MATYAINAIEALEVVSRFPKLTKELIDGFTKVADSVVLFSAKVATLVEDAIKKVDSLHATELQQCTEARRAFFELSEVYDIADTFVLKAVDSFECACDETETSRVKDETMHSNFGPLIDFILQLQRYLSEAGQLYVKLDEACNEASESSTRAAELCKVKTREARSKKRATRAIGGTVAGGAIATGATGGVAAGVAAGGVAASAIAGAFTAGIGTVIGLGITAVATTVVGVGGGVGAAAITYFVAEDFEETEKNFRMYSENFDFLATSALTLHENVSGLHRRLEALATYVDEVESSRNHQEVARSVCRAVDLLHRRSKESFDVLSECRETVRVKASELRLKLYTSQ